MQNESLMVHGYINGNFTPAPFSLSAPHNSPLPHLPVLTASSALLMLQALLQGRDGRKRWLPKKVTAFDQCPHWALIKCIIGLQWYLFNKGYHTYRLKPKYIITDKKTGIYPKTTFRYSCPCIDYINQVDFLQSQIHLAPGDFFKRKV